MTAALFLSLGAASVRSDGLALNAWASTLCDVVDRDDIAFVGLLSVLALLATLSNRVLARRRAR